MKKQQDFCFEIFEKSLKKNLSYLKILMIKIEYRVPHYKSDVDFSSLPYVVNVPLI